MPAAAYGRPSKHMPHLLDACAVGHKRCKTTAPLFYESRVRSYVDVCCKSDRQARVWAGMENFSKYIQAKFDAARKLLDAIEAAGIATPRITSLQIAFSGLETRYALTTAHLLMVAAEGELGRFVARDEYTRTVTSENFVGDLDRVVEDAKTILINEQILPGAEPSVEPKRAPPRIRAKSAVNTKLIANAPDFSEKIAAKVAAALPAKNAAPSKIALAAKQASPPLKTGERFALRGQAERLLGLYPRGNSLSMTLCENSRSTPPDVQFNAQKIEYDRCETCGVPMGVDPEKSELRCGGCNVVRQLVGTVFDESQFYSQEGQKSKSGSFNPNRHFYHWWTHLLAREPEEEIGDPEDHDNLYGEKLVEALRGIIRRDNKILRFITVYDVRNMIREISRTDLNKNVPLLMKRLTGVGPPQPGDQLTIRVERIFSVAIEIGERSRRAGRVNRDYYPFYIGKILDAILPEKDPLRRILYYIYLQGADTLIADDLDWEVICDELPKEYGITYVATDRAKFQQYRPD